MKTPLFPLQSVILPRGRVPLKLFEPRYLDMLTRCLKQDRGFVTLLLRSGSELRGDEDFYDIGTYVRVVDFAPLEGGLLGITVEGVAKAYVVRHWRAPDGLMLGDVEWLMDEPAVPMPEDGGELVEVLQALLQHPVVRDLGMSIDFEDSRDVGWRLTELLPIDRHDKQRLVELTDPLERLAQLETVLRELGD